MSNNKENSVEWLEKEVHKILNEYDQHAIGFYLEKAFQQAKAMHKHEIMAAYDTGNQNQYDKINFEDYLNVDEEQYYNETYGGNNG